MSRFVADLLRRVRERICMGGHANGRTLISILPLRESPPSERLPWEPSGIELTPHEVQLLAWLWWELNQELAPETAISECDVLHFALQELQLKIQSGRLQDVFLTRLPPL